MKAPPSRFFPLAMFLLSLPKSSQSQDLTWLSSWSEMLACTADLNSSHLSLLDQQSCHTRLDSHSEPCLWCDLTDLIGSGACVNSDIKNVAGAFWDQLCTDAATPVPTSSPTLPTVSSPPVWGWTDTLACSMDTSSNRITEENVCLSKRDTTSESAQMCVWCELPLLGGGCITNADAEKLSWMCNNSFGDIPSMRKEEAMQHTLLRGEKSHAAVYGWQIMDPSCTGDDSLTDNGSEEQMQLCTDRSDSSGQACQWCNGAGVLGVCVSSMQRDILGNFLDCDTIAAVETLATK